MTTPPHPYRLCGQYRDGVAENRVMVCEVVAHKVCSLTRSIYNT
jgi:hypothetical protein